MFRNNSGGPQQYRELLSDARLQVSAKAEIAKLGANFNFDPGNLNSKGDLLARRAECRRVVDAIRGTIVRDKADTLTDDKLNTIEYLGAEISLISNKLDLLDATASGYQGGNNAADTALRDEDGREIGTLLSNATLRNQGKIADQLKVRDYGTDQAPTLSEFFRGVAEMKTSTAVRNSLSEGTNTAGGYTVPTILLPGILAALVPPSSLLSAGAQIAVISDQGKSFNIAAVNSIPTAAWRNEAAALAFSDPAFRSISITPRSLAFITKISRELLQDSPNLEDALRIAIAGAFAKELDRAGLRGSGTTPEITGLLNTAGVQTVTNGANGTSLTDYSNFISAMQAIKSADAPTPNAAIMHPRSEAKLAGLKDTTNQPLRRPPAVDQWHFGSTSQIPTALTVGTSTDCSEMYVGDFSNFVFFMREGISIQRVIELYAATGEIGFMCHTRVDVAVLYPAAFAIVTGVRP